MDRCPVEIIDQIFALACVDEGRTSHALSLVSKHFHDIASPYRFQALSIHFIEDLVRILDVVSRRPPHMRRVKHLYLNIVICGWIPSKATTRIIQLLSLLSADLQTLSLFTLEHWVLIIPTELPALRELTLFAHINPPAFVGSLQAPRLERLHIAYYDSLPEGFAECISRIAPKLTHLRISNVSQDRQHGNGDLLNAIASFNPGSSLEPKYTFPIRDTPSRKAEYPYKFPPSLQKCIIAQAATRTIKYDSVQCLYTYLASQLERLGAEDTSGKLHILKLAPYKRATLYWDSSHYSDQWPEMRKEWEERIDGGDGCWNPREIRVIPRSVQRPWVEIM